jgi:hypothetical protein
MSDALLSIVADTPDPEAERAARRARTLEALAGIGMAMARALRDRMALAESVEAACEISRAFTRIARAVRLTVALEARLSDAQQLRAARLAAKAAERRAAIAAAGGAEAPSSSGDGPLAAHSGNGRLDDEPAAEASAPGPPFRRLS